MQAAQACTFAHTHGFYGENLYASTSSPANWSAVISAWAGEAPAYRSDNPYLSGENGHFTQLIWKDTRYIGCAWQQCSSIANLDWPSGGIIYYCELFNLSPAPFLEGTGSLLAEATREIASCCPNPPFPLFPHSLAEKSSLGMGWHFQPLHGLSASSISHWALQSLTAFQIHQIFNACQMAPRWAPAGKAQVPTGCFWFHLAAASLVVYRQGPVDDIAR